MTVAFVAPFTFRTESDTPAPTRLEPVDDRLSADEALKRVRRGEVLLHTGDFHNAKQLVSAMERRLTRTGPPPATPLQAFRAERAARAEAHRLLGSVVLRLDGAYRLELSRAPDVAQACLDVWGPPPPEGTVVALKTLLGMLGAAQWRKTGLAVPGLTGRVHPHYGVYAPTRGDYVSLLARVERVRGARVFDVGTGTGVLSFLLLQRGAASAVATDVDPRAVACARENAQRLGLASRYEVVEQAGFPSGTADLVVCNPPWIPERPRTAVDRAVFDDDGAFLRAFVEGLSGHLAPGGRGLLVLSDLAVRLGLRSEDFLSQAFTQAGLKVAETHQQRATHGKAKDPTDPLHHARSGEVTSLYELVVAE